MTDNPSYMGPGEVRWHTLRIPGVLVLKEKLKDDADTLAESLMPDVKALLVSEIRHLQGQVGDGQEPSRDDGP